MKKSKLMAALPFLTLAACLVPIACTAQMATEGEGADKEVSRASGGADLTAAESDLNAAASVAPAEANVTLKWGISGYESCFDLCGRPNCNCINPICPGNPVEGQPCNYRGPTGAECFSKPRGGSTVHFFCGNP